MSKGAVVPQQAAQHGANAGLLAGQTCSIALHDLGSALPQAWVDQPEPPLLPSLTDRPPALSQQAPRSMVLGLSLGEMAVLVAAAAWVLGGCR
jgi:hypothetical protein